MWPLCSITVITTFCPTFFRKRWHKLTLYPLSALLNAQALWLPWSSPLLGHHKYASQEASQEAEAGGLKVECQSGQTKQNQSTTICKHRAARNHRTHALHLLHTNAQVLQLTSLTNCKLRNKILNNL